MRAFIDGFLGSVPGAFIVLDKAWRLVYLNDDARQFFLNTGESLLGRPLEETYPRQFGYLLAPQTIRGLLKGKENTVTRYVNRFSKWFKISAYSSDSGIFIRMEDVTPEMVVNRFRIFNQFSVDRAGDMIFWFTPNGHIIYANKAASKSLKFEKKELTSLMVADIDPSFTDHKWAAFVNDLRTRESMVYESSFQASDRSIILVEVTCNYLVYYGEEYLIASARDITNRKRAEEALRESEEKFRRFFEIPLIGAAITSPEKRFIQVNDKLCEMFGYSREELLQTSWDKITSPEDMPKNLDAFTRVMSGEIDTYTFEKRFIHKNGSIVYVILSVECIRREDGTVDYLISNYNDITKRKQGEIALQEAKDQAEIYLDLMGHDINNLNQIALGFLELANDRLTDDEVRDLISKPLEAITSSSSLIENVRKLQKSRTDGLRIEAIDLNDVLSELKTRYLNTPDKEVHIELISSPDAFIMANGLIKDVFSNLIANAIKHSNDVNPVNIHIQLERITGVKEFIRVAIEDNGPGIPDELKTKLFARFQRGNTKATGKGLGLYLVKTLLDDFHGKVWAEDRIQGDYTQGSRFVVTLPAAEK